MILFLLLFTSAALGFAVGLIVGVFFVPEGIVRWVGRHVPAELPHVGHTHPMTHSAQPGATRLGAAPGHKSRLLSTRNVLLLLAISLLANLAAGGFMIWQGAELLAAKDRDQALATCQAATTQAADDLWTAIRDGIRKGTLGQKSIDKAITTYLDTLAGLQKARESDDPADITGICSRANFEAGKVLQEVTR